MRGSSEKQKGASGVRLTGPKSAPPYPGFRERNRPLDEAHIGEREERSKTVRPHALTASRLEKGRLSPQTLDDIARNPEGKPRRVDREKRSYAG